MTIVHALIPSTSLYDIPTMGKVPSRFKEYKIEFCVISLFMELSYLFTSVGGTNISK